MKGPPNDTKYVCESSVINEHFATTSERLLNSTSTPFDPVKHYIRTQHYTPNAFEFQLVDSKEVRKVIKCMKSNKKDGIGLDSTIIKRLNGTIVDEMVHIIILHAS